MRYLDQLLQTILALGYPPKQVEAWVEQGDIYFTPDDHIDGFELRYTTSFLLSNLKIEPLRFFAQVVFWLAKNNPERDELGLAKPQYFVTPLSDNKIDLALKIEFSESVEVVEDTEGDWQIDGVTYKVVNDNPPVLGTHELEQVANINDGLNNV